MQFFFFSEGYRVSHSNLNIVCLIFSLETSELMYTFLPQMPMWGSTCRGLRRNSVGTYKKRKPCIEACFPPTRMIAPRMGLTKPEELATAFSPRAECAKWNLSLRGCSNLRPRHKGVKECLHVLNDSCCVSLGEDWRKHNRHYTDLRKAVSWKAKMSQLKIERTEKLVS